MSPLASLEPAMPSPFRAGSRYPPWPWSPRCQARFGQVRGIPRGPGARDAKPVSGRFAVSAVRKTAVHKTQRRRKPRQCRCGPEGNRVHPWSPRCQARFGQVRGIRRPQDRRPQDRRPQDPETAEAPAVPVRTADSKAPTARNKKPPWNEGVPFPSLLGVLASWRDSRPVERHLA